MAAVAGLVLGGAGLGLNIFGSIKAKKAAKKAAARAAKIANLNAEGFMLKAANAQQRSLQAQRSHYFASAKFVGSQDAALAAGMINTDFGSAAEVRDYTAASIAEDAMTLHTNGMNEIADVAHQSRVARAGGNAAAARIRAQGSAQFISGIASSVSNAGSLANAYAASKD